MTSMKLNMTGMMEPPALPSHRFMNIVGIEKSYRTVLREREREIGVCPVRLLIMCYRQVSDVW